MQGTQTHPDRAASVFEHPSHANQVNAFPFSTPIHSSCSEALSRVQRSLERRGLRALETFNLQDARLGSGECTCPRHGTAECDCQMVVLMVYGEATMPTTLMLHGNDGQTWISLSDAALEQPAHGVDALIVNAIEEATQAFEAGQGL